MKQFKQNPLEDMNVFNKVTLSDADILNFKKTHLYIDIWGIVAFILISFIAALIPPKSASSPLLGMDYGLKVIFHCIFFAIIIAIGFLYDFIRLRVLVRQGYKYSGKFTVREKAVIYRKHYFYTDVGRLFADEKLFFSVAESEYIILEKYFKNTHRSKLSIKLDEND